MKFIFLLSLNDKDGDIFVDFKIDDEDDPKPIDPITQAKLITYIHSLQLGQFISIHAVEKILERILEYYRKINADTKDVSSMAASLLLLTSVSNQDPVVMPTEVF